MRCLTTILAPGTLATWCAPTRAATPRSECRSACQPWIAEQLLGPSASTGDLTFTFSATDGPGGRSRLAWLHRR